MTQNLNQPQEMTTEPTASTITVHCAFTELVDAIKLQPHPRNPNKHGDKQIALLAKIIRHQGWRAPIVVSKRSGFIVAGHGRLQAAQLLQVENVPVDYQDFATEADEYAHLVADNRIAELAEIDDAELAGLLKELDGKIDLDLTGFDSDALAELDGFMDETEVDAEPQIDKGEELRAKWNVQPGQLWELGDHRILCGDSTKAEDAELVMGGEKAALVVTDPPYGVSYASKNAFLNSMDKGNKVQAQIENDHLSKEETQAMWKSAFANMIEVMSPGAAVYCFMPQGGDQMMMMMMMMMEAGIEPRHEIIWLKNNHVLGRSDYQYKHEPILYAWKKGGHKFYGGFQTSVIDCPRPQSSKEHPTMKPVELAVKLVRNSSQSGDILYEPFSGSGTTIIACEQLGRKCRAIEISPAYVAVALQRWADATGKTPKLING